MQVGIGCQRHQLLQGAVCCCCVQPEKNAINATCMIGLASIEGSMSTSSSRSLSNRPAQPAKGAAQKRQATVVQGRGSWARPACRRLPRTNNVLHFPVCLRTMDQLLPFGRNCRRLLPSHHLLPASPFLPAPNRLSTSTVFVSTSVAAAVVGFLRAKGQALGVTGAASHLVGRIPFFSIQPNLLYDVAQVGKIEGVLGRSESIGSAQVQGRGGQGMWEQLSSWGKPGCTLLCLPCCSPHHITLDPAILCLKVCQAEA